jgi:hypothetical protein
VKGLQEALAVTIFSSKALDRRYFDLFEQRAEAGRMAIDHLTELSLVRRGGRGRSRRDRDRFNAIGAEFLRVRENDQQQ